MITLFCVLCNREPESSLLCESPAWITCPKCGLGVSRAISYTAAARRWNLMQRAFLGDVLTLKRIRTQVGRHLAHNAVRKAKCAARKGAA